LSKKRNKRRPSLDPNAQAPAESMTSGLSGAGVHWLDQYSSVIVFILVIASFSVNSYTSNLERRGRITTIDESVYSRLGLQLKEGLPYNTIPMYNETLKSGRKLPGYFKDPLFKHPPTFPFLISIVYTALPKKTGYTFQELYTLSSKVPNMMGCLLILVIFLIGRRFFDVRVGLLAALIVAVEVNYLNCSHKVWMETTLAAFFWLSMYLFHKGLERPGYFLLAGVACGCAMLTKYPAVLILPIWFTFVLIYKRSVFRSLFFYGGLFIAGIMFLPWLLEVLDIYGSGFISGKKIGSWRMGTLHGFFYIFAAAVLAALIFLIFKWKRPETVRNLEKHTHWLNKTVAMLIGLSVCYLLLQGDFRESIVISLTWFGFPVTGWEMYSFNEEPRYFYIKQILKYSPYYIFFLIALIKAPLAAMNERFLMVAAFWTLLFASYYGSFQGRYILYFMPAAILLAAKLAVEIFDRILEEKSVIRISAASVFCVILVYFYAKTLQVGIYHAITNNVAYY